MQTLGTISSILSDCDIRYGTITLLPRVVRKGDGFLLQLRAYLPDNNTGELTLQAGAKYYISSYAIDDEVVMTLWKATQDFIIHEAREQFTYKGQRIFGPHLPIDKLVKFCQLAGEVKR